MNKGLQFLVLPSEVTDFERGYLARVNRVALVFFALHVPAFMVIAWVNGTGPGLAGVLTAAAMIGPALAHRAAQNPRFTSVIFGVTAMFMGGILVHFGQGPVQIEMHFYFFALIAMCAVFGNPLVIVAAALTVAAHHLLVWLVLPQSVFNYEAQWWVVAVHAAFVVLESAAACFISRSFFDNVIRLERIVRARTAELDNKNRDMRLLLDNVRQGFLTLNRAGVIAAERSAAVDSWFGAPAPSATWFEYLATLSPSFAENTEVSWSEVVEGVMPLEVTLEQMPARLRWRDAHYRFEYRPIGASEPHEHYLVIVTDVTMEVARERGEVERREAMALFERVLVDRTGLEGFFEETTQTLRLLQSGAETDTARRLVHTLKGNAGLFGLFSVAECCHRLEDELSESAGALPAAAFADLQVRWNELTGEIAKLLGARSDMLEIEAREYVGLEAAARAGESAPALLRRIRRLKLESTAKRLGHFQERALKIADRLGKGGVRVEVEDNAVRLDHARWAGFWNAFVHAVRNALDHGIEPLADRQARGKEGAGALALRTYEDDSGRVVIEIQDDGRGVDWQSVAARAAAAGLPHRTSADLEQALFSDGVSTALSVTDVSGRGVGMGALLAATEELGGQLDVRSTWGKGTTLRFVFPPTSASAKSLRPTAAE
ncbi:MAG: hypothetical protein EOO73_36125 [Myxococcales bacterium]|nr:MAG: hypothetical protein EOO73_36125 [Myxococcales bacterium]